MNNVPTNELNMNLGMLKTQQKRRFLVKISNFDSVNNNLVMRKNIIYIAVATIIGAMMMLCGCDPVPSKPVLAVSIQPQKYLLEKIVGDKFDILCLLAQGSNPEAYEPSFNHLVNLEKSKAYFRIGNIGFELAILDKVKKNNPDLMIVDTSSGIDYLKGTHEGVSAKGHRHEHHRHEIDPHVWSSVRNAKIIAGNMYKSVLKIDAKNKKIYEKNYNALIAEIDVLEEHLKHQLETVSGQAFAVWHPSLSYFARDYGLKQIAMENEGKEVPASVLKETIDHAKANGVKVMFYQKEFDNRQVQAVNQQLGARLVEINPMNYNWADELKKIANALTAE